MTSKHYESERSKREEIIRKYIDEDEDIIDGFIIDRGHKNGMEIHSITRKGVIIIYNLITGKLITKLIARDEQIKRYYESTGRKHPEDYESILLLAQLHEILGYNDI